MFIARSASEASAERCLFCGRWTPMGGCPSVSESVSLSAKNDLQNNNRILQTALNDLRAKNRPHSIKGSLKNPIVAMKATKGYKLHFLTPYEPKTHSKSGET